MLSLSLQLLPLLFQHRPVFFYHDPHSVLWDAGEVPEKHKSAVHLFSDIRSWPFECVCHPPLFHKSDQLDLIWWVGGLDWYKNNHHNIMRQFVPGWWTGMVLVGQQNCCHLEFYPLLHVPDLPLLHLVQKSCPPERHWDFRQAVVLTYLTMADVLH